MDGGAGLSWWVMKTVTYVKIVLGRESAGEGGERGGARERSTNILPFCFSCCMTGRGGEVGASSNAFSLGL